MTTLPSQPSPGAVPTSRSFFTRNTLLAAAGLGIAGIGLAASLVFRPAPAEVSPGSVDTTRASLAANESLVERSGTPVPPAAAPRSDGPGTAAAPRAAAIPVAQT